MDMKKCVVCLVQFSPNDISLVKFTDEDSRNRNKISCVYRKILKIFCKYFNLPFKHNENENEKDGQNQEESETSPSFPFCVECRNLVAELCIFHEKSESIQEIIQKTVAKITMKIVQTENDKGNCSNSDLPETQENGARKGNKMKHEYRRKIFQSFNPRVDLTDCQTQYQNRNQNQEKVPSETTDTNEINWATTNLEDESPLNHDNFHGNGNDKDDINGNGGDQNDRNAKVISLHPDLSQEVKKNSAKNSNLNLPSIPVDENSAGEKTKENIMQQIRAKFNTQPQNFPPLENSTPEKKSQKETHYSDSKQQRSEQNCLKDKMSSRNIENLGDGKYLYKNSWPFHIIENQEFFKCDTCQSQIGFYKNPQIKLYTSIIKHIREKHKSSTTKVRKIDTDGKSSFRYLEKWTFDKVELGFKCGHCPKICTKLRSIKEHLEIWHVPGKFKCSKCPQSCRTQAFLNLHRCGWNLQINHRSYEISPGSGKFVYSGKKQNWEFQLIDGKFQCSSCPAVGLKRDYILNHLRLYHDAATTHMCDECGRIFSQECNLTRHKMTHLKKHVEDKARKRAESKFPCVCPHCQKTYKNENGLKVHICRRHKDIGIVMTTTTTTTAETTESTNSKQEIQEENGQESSDILKFPCGKCSRRFISAVWLKKHEKNHDELICPQCDKKFEGKSLFQRHLDRHNKVFRFFCDVCNKGFLTHSEVGRHKETGVHSRKEETVKSKEESAQFMRNSKAQKGKRRQKESSDEESEENQTETEESASEGETDESESENSEETSTSEDEEKEED